MSRSLALGALAFTVSACCFTPAPAPIPPPPGLSPTGVATPGPLAPGILPGPAIGLVTLTFGDGVAPDPLIHTGIAGGPIAASALSPNCYAGNYPPQPQVTLHVAQPMPLLTVIAAGDGDLTLAVRAPGGMMSCDDDGDTGVNPRVRVGAVPGDYAIYVGTFGSGTPQPFTLGVTSMSAMAAPLLTEGAVLRHGRLTVTSSTGPSMVQVGTICEYVQVGHTPSTAGGVDVRWRLVCNESVLYGNGSNEGDAGFSYLHGEGWPEGTLVLDMEPSSVDTDPAFTWDATGIRVWDDTGWSGAHDTRFVEIP